MNLKSLEDLLKAIKDYPIDESLVVIVSGKDPQIFNVVSSYVEKEKFKNKQVEITVLTGEQEDFSYFLNDIYNFPLFIPHRLFIVKQGQIVLKNVRELNLNELSPKTWILIEYEDQFPQKILKIDENKLLHYETKILYENQIDQFLHSLGKKYQLQFSEEAINEIKLLFPPKESILRTVVSTIKKTFAPESESIYYVTYEDIRTIFYPSQGWDMFKIIDASFNKDLQTFLVEIEKYNPPEDTFLSLLKNFLNKTNELRQYLIAKHLNMSDKEILKYINAEKKPIFIQKKILSQLEQLSSMYNLDTIETIYNFLVEMAFSFRQNISDENKKTLFVKRAIEVFFCN